ncbi:MAG: thioredoxin domain-containing protein [Deltaproteobacteria bacterium]|nr:thioredoxin domain-containing protein [Deltaproteobacteria bacterium]
MRKSFHHLATLPVALTLCAGLISLGGSCKTEAPKPDAKAPEAPAATPAAEPEAEAEAAAGGGSGVAGAELGDEALARTLPGVKVEGLDEKARASLLKVAEDAVCDCGRPSTLGGCLRDPNPCELGRRMADLSVLLLKAGAKPGEAVSFTEEYFEGFKPARRKTFEVAEAACKGPKDAPIQLVEFADFECPYCGITWPLFGDIVDSLKGKARLCFLNFPLSQHENAREAAQLTVMAREQGKFEQAADLLFANQTQLDRKSLLDHADTLGLDRAAVSKALEEGKYDAVVEAERKQGQAAGIEGTPSLFINGRSYTLLLDAAMILRAIQDELDWQAGGEQWSKPGSAQK